MSEPHKVKKLIFEVDLTFRLEADTALKAIEKCVALSPIEPTNVAVNPVAHEGDSDD